MLHDIHSYPGTGRSGQSAGRPSIADQARRNPWLRWRPKRPKMPQVLSVAELAECRCPDICNRDHANE